MASHTRRMAPGARARLALALCLAIPGIARAGDWPQWGGTDARNHLSAERGLPSTFGPGTKRTDGSGIDPTTTRAVRWVARLGSAAYGNPTVAAGRVYVGTDDLTVAADPRLSRTRGGMVKCFDESSGRLLWQLVTRKRERLPEGSHFGHQHLGTCSSPTVDGKRVYAVTSAAEVVCLDAAGFEDGNDGPFLDEPGYLAGPGQPPIPLSLTDADILWRYDLMTELGVRPHDAASCSVLVHGDLIYLSTSNGVDRPHERILNPDAPAIVALDKKTGRLAATDGIGLSGKLHHAQWSPPSLGRVRDRALVFFGGGDGVCYAFEARDRADASPRPLALVWSYDCNPPEYKFRDGKPIPLYEGDKRKRGSPNRNDGSYVGPSEIIATPVFHGDRVYVALGQDPAHGRGRGMLHCIDATGTGDITASGRVWSYAGLDRTIASATIADGLVYIPDVAGRLHCLDARDGHPLWVHDTGAETWGSALVADAKVYFGTKKELRILAAGRALAPLASIPLGSAIFSTPIAANGTLYVASQQYLWAVRDRIPPARDGE